MVNYTFFTTIVFCYEIYQRNFRSLKMDVSGTRHNSKTTSYVYGRQKSLYLALTNTFPPSFLLVTLVY